MADFIDTLDAATALATEFKDVGEAARFIRAETSLGLRESVQHAQRTAISNPNTPLGRAYAALPEASVWRGR